MTLNNVILAATLYNKMALPPLFVPFSRQSAYLTHCASYLFNILPTPDWITPYWVLLVILPLILTFVFLVVLICFPHLELYCGFGCICFSHLEPYVAYKLEDRSKPCVFLYYSPLTYLCKKCWYSSLIVLQHVAISPMWLLIICLKFSPLFLELVDS